MFVIPDIPNWAAAIRSLTVLVMISSTSSQLTSKTPTLDLMTVRLVISSLCVFISLSGPTGDLSLLWANEIRIRGSFRCHKAITELVQTGDLVVSSLTP